VYVILASSVSKAGFSHQFLIVKYEYRRFLDKKALVTSKLGPSKSASTLPTANSTPPSLPARPAQVATATDIAANMFSATNAQLRSYPAQSQPTRSISQPVISPNSTTQSTPAARPEGVWADLVSLQGPATNASLPLQYQASVPTPHGLTTSNSMPMGFPGASMNMPPAGFSMGAPSLNPFFQQSFTTGTFV
jgi:stromal membrane-associated protein